MTDRVVVVAPAVNDRVVVVRQAQVVTVAGRGQQGAPGPPGPPGPPGDASGAVGEPRVAELISDAVGGHIVDTEPHPAYDDMPSLVLIFENGLI